MADKVPVTFFADPDVETEFTIKPFAAQLAARPQSGGNQANTTMTAGMTLVNGNTDADYDYDYS
jgi:hypothetical protein